MLHGFNDFQCTTLFSTRILHTEKFPAVLLYAGNEKVKHLFYVILCFWMVGQ
jgi:hypothetical protein